VILLDVYVNVYFWAFLRFCYGFAMAATFVVGDSWFNHAAKNEFRGKVMSIYMATTYAGISLGQIFLFFVGDLGDGKVLVFVGSLLALASSSILLTIQPAPPLANPVRMSARLLFRRVPVSVTTGFLVGFLLVNIGTMLPIMFSQEGLLLSVVALTMLSYQLGGFLGQYPLGYLSDLVDRRIVVALALLVASVMVVLLFMMVSWGLFGGGEGWLVWVVMFILGFAVLPLYGVNVAHANDRLNEEEVLGAASTLVFLNSVGGMVGPLAAGFAMNGFGGESLLVLLFVFLVLGLTFTVYRIVLREGVAVEDDDRSSYSALPRNVTPLTQYVTQDDAEEGLWSDVISEGEGEKSE
jgi:MFS family permease